MQEWCQAASGGQAAFPAAGLAFPLGSLLITERLTTAQRALAQRRWELARPVLSAMAAGLRVGHREMPGPGARAGVRLLLARLAVALGQDPSGELAEARALGADPAGLSVVQAWAARRQGRPDEAAERLAEARASAAAAAPGTAVLAQIVVETIAQARAVSAEDGLAAARNGLGELAQVADLPGELDRLVEPVPPELWFAVAEQAAARRDAQAGAALDRAERGAGEDAPQLRAAVLELRADLLAAPDADPGARAGALVAAGHWRVDTGQPELAERHYLLARELQPDNAQAALGLVLARTPELAPEPDADSIRVATEAIAQVQAIHAEHGLDADSLWSLSSLAYWQLYLAQAAVPGRGWQALLTAARGLAIQADRARGWLLLAEAARTLGLYQCAAFAARRARALDPAPEPDEELLASLISTAVSLGDINAVAGLLPADTEEVPGWLKGIAGYVQWRSGSRSAAIALLRGAVQEDPANLWAQIELVRDLLLDGQPDSARLQAAEVAARAGGRKDRDAVTAAAWSALVSGDFATAERLGGELTLFENDCCDDAEGVLLTGMAKRLAGRDGFDDLAASLARARSGQLFDTWLRAGRPLVETLARERGIAVSDLARLDDVVRARGSVLAAWSDPVTELTQAPPGIADPDVIAQARALLGVLLREAEPAPAAARAALADGAPAGQALPEWPGLAARVRQGYVTDGLARGELGDAGSAEEERLAAVPDNDSAGRLPEIALLMAAAGQPDDARRVLRAARRLAGDKPELTRTGATCSGTRASATRPPRPGRTPARRATTGPTSGWRCSRRPNPTAPGRAGGFRAAITRSYAETAADLHALPMKPADTAAVVEALEDAARDPDTAPGAWIAIRILAHGSAPFELPSARLRVWYASSLVAGDEDRESGGVLATRYISEARLRLPWLLPGVNLSEITDYEPGRYEILVLNTVFEEGTVPGGASYVPSDAIPLLSSALQAKVTGTTRQDLVLLGEDAEPVTGTDRLLLVPAPEVIARRLQIVANLFRTSVQ